MNRYQKLFTYLHQKKMGALVPFISIGDPNPTFFMYIIDTIIKFGADALELGFPFSDPLSDGPSIQKSMKRALCANINIISCFKILYKIREKYPNYPIGLLVYANLIFKYGIKNFYTRCSQLNIDSILIPDVPIEESEPFYKEAIYHAIAQIFICPPNATVELIHNIIDRSNGYIYLLSRPGVTGYSNILTENTQLNNIILQINQYKKMFPILQGFGIYTPKQAQQSLLLGTSGVIVGSAIADIIEQHTSDLDTLLSKLKNWISSMKNSMYL